MVYGRRIFTILEQKIQTTHDAKNTHVQNKWINLTHILFRLKRTHAHFHSYFKLYEWHNYTQHKLSHTVHTYRVMNVFI